MAKILVVDDSAFMRKILINTLKKEGYTEIIEGENGIEAVDKYKAEKPALVLLDVVMEKKEGIDALKEIVAADPAAKVVMVTAVGQEQMVQEAMASGAKGYIVKPFDAAKVIETVKGLVAS